MISVSMTLAYPTLTANIVTPENEYEAFSEPFKVTAEFCCYNETCGNISAGLYRHQNFFTSFSEDFNRPDNATTGYGWHEESYINGSYLKLEEKISDNQSVHLIHTLGINYAFTLIERNLTFIPSHFYGASQIYTPYSEPTWSGYYSIYFFNSTDDLIGRIYFDTQFVSFNNCGAGNLPPRHDSCGICPESDSNTVCEKYDPGASGGLKEAHNWSGNLSSLMSQKMLYNNVNRTLLRSAVQMRDNGGDYKMFFDDIVLCKQGLDCPEERPETAIISQNSDAKRFYVNTSNPINFELLQNECVNQTWHVTSTAKGGDIFAFYTTAALVANTSVNTSSQNINITAHTRSIKIYNIERLHPTSQTEIFDITIENNGSSPVNVSWNVSFDDGATEQSEEQIEIGVNSNVSVLIEHEYPSQGEFTLVFNASGYAVFDTENLTLNIGGIDISDFSQIYENTNTTIVELEIENYDGQTIKAVNWSVDFGSENVSSNTKINMNEEGLSVLIEYSYPVLGPHNLSAVTKNGTYQDNTILGLTLDSLFIGGFTNISRNDTLRTFVFDIGQYFNTSQSITWSFNTGDNVSFGDTVYDVLTKEYISQILEHNYSNSGNYTTTIEVNTSEKNYSDTLQVAIG